MQALITKTIIENVKFHDIEFVNEELKKIPGFEKYKFVKVPGGTIDEEEKILNAGFNRDSDERFAKLIADNLIEGKVTVFFTGNDSYSWGIWIEPGHYRKTTYRQYTSLTGKPSYKDLKVKILSWAKDRELLNENYATNQLVKIGEEVGELMSAHIRSNREKIIDALGDVLVTLIVYSEQQKIDLEEALQTAYEGIKDRKGKTVNGSFIKEEKNA